jgi:hypothetical protein
MPNVLSIILLCLLIGAAPALADQQQPAAPPAQITPADRQVAAVMEILQLMDLAEEIDMIKDMNYLIEDDQNENQTD